MPAVGASTLGHHPIIQFLIYVDEFLQILMHKGEIPPQCVVFTAEQIAMVIEQFNLGGRPVFEASRVNEHFVS